MKNSIKAIQPQTKCMLSLEAYLTLSTFEELQFIRPWPNVMFMAQQP